MVILRLAICALTLVGLCPTLWAKQKTFLLSLPPVLFGYEGTPHMEWNVANKVGLSFDYTGIARNEVLSKREMTADPGRSLIMGGYEFAMGVGRYSQAQNMGGLYWGLSVGYRMITGEWKKDGEGIPTLGLAPDEFGKMHHNFQAKGPTTALKVGYRFVGDDLGFVAGISATLRHFQNTVTDTKAKEADDHDTTLAEVDSATLSRRLMTRFTPGIEIGWAF